MRKNTVQTMWLGIFVIVGIAIFILAVYFIGNRQNLFGATTKISSVFKNVNGLQLGNNVRFSGVNVGTVKGITFINDTSICVDMYIDTKTIPMIRKNSTATINSDGLVGNMIVNIIPGEDNLIGPVEPGDTLVSQSKIATVDMLNTLSTTNENAALLTADLLKITNSINKGEGVIGALVKDELMAKDFKETVSLLKQAGLETRRTVSELNSLISSIDLNEGVIGTLLKDSVSAKKVSEMIKNLDQSSMEIRKMASNLEQFSEQLDSKEGTLNLVLRDSSFAGNLERTLENAEQASEKLNENLEALKHNFLFRGYFRRLERQKKKQEIQDSIKEQPTEQGRKTEEGR